MVRVMRRARRPGAHMRRRARPILPSDNPDWPDVPEEWTEWAPGEIAYVALGCGDPPKEG